MKKLFKYLYKHRFDIFLSIMLIVITTMMFVFLPKDETKNIINYLENKTFDIRQNIIAKDKKASEDIVIITVDDPSYEYLIEKYGDWPIPRNVHAEILDYVQSQHPKYVLFDLLFVKSLRRIPQSDNKLIQNFKKYKNTYTAINFDNYSAEVRTPPFINEKIKTNINIQSNNLNPYEYTNCRMILDEIINATSNIGHINIQKSEDGFTRTVPVIVNYKPDGIKNNYFLYMTIKMAVDYLNTYENQEIKEIIIDKNNNLILGSKKIPLTSNGEMILNWYGKSGTEVDNTFKYVSFWEVIKSIQSKKEGKKELLPADFFKNKIVYIGTNVFALSDINTVPTSKYLPGVEIHATLFNNILDNNSIHKTSLPYNILITVILAAAAAFTVFRIRSVYVSVMMFFIFLGFYLFVTVFAMTKYNAWIWIVVPVFIAGFVFVCSYIVKYLIKSRDYEYTYKLATTDGLTELFNHRFFQDKMKNQILECGKAKNNFSLIMTDIDFFKKFNDKYGHQAGDAVLKHVSKTLKSCVRNEDFVCRYGGEEMAVILNKTNKEKALEIAEKICKTVSAKKFDLTPDIEVSVTISLGVSTYPEDGKTAAELIEYADKCLYNAKENGRNQVGTYT